MRWSLRSLAPTDLVTLALRYSTMGKAAKALTMLYCVGISSQAARWNWIVPGQACSAISRVLVHSSVRDEYLALLKEKAQSAGPSMLIDNAAIERVERYVEVGKEQGELLFGGARPADDEYAKGCYFEPTAFAFADQSSPVCRDEIFGPVVSVLTFESDKEALALANDTDYGLLVSLWTREPKRQRYCIRRLEVGVVAVNNASMLSHRTPWGGIKQSGIGRRYGEMGLEPFFEYKTVWIS